MSAARERPGPLLRFALAVLATWRVTHLLAAEDGPGGVVAHARARLGSGALGALADCFACLSVWVAAAFAWYPARGAGRRELAVTWIALSGAACLVERAAEPPEHVLDLGITNGGEHDGLLQPEAIGGDHHAATNG